MKDNLWRSLRTLLGERADYLRLQYDLALEEGKIILEPPHREKGEFYLGEIIGYDLLTGKTFTKPLQLTKEELNKHLLILGETGSGKTNLISLLLSQLLRQDEITCLVFDFKQDYRHLIKQSQNLVVISWQQFQFNPLSLPVQEFCDVFCQDSSLLLGSKGFLLETITRLNKHNPTPLELLHYLNQVKLHPASREAQYLAVVKNRIKTMILELGEVIDCREGIPMETLLANNIVLELDGLGKEMQDFLVNALLRKIFLYKIKKNQRGKLQHLVVFDEAKRVFDVNKERRPIEGIPTIDILAGQVREFGEGLIIADQEPSKLTDSIKANTHSKIVFHLGHGKDILDIARSISLQQQDFLGKLSVGEAIVKVGKDDPFLLRVPLQNIEKTVTNKDVQERFDLFSHKNRQFPFVSALSRQVSTKKRERELLSIMFPPKLKINETRLLKQIAVFPYLPIEERRKKLEWSSGLFNKIKVSLIEKGLITDYPLRVGKFARVNLLRITKQRKLFLQNQGIHTSNETPEHQYWMHHIRTHYEKSGYTVKEEYNYVDLVAFKKNEVIGNEIETGKSDWKANTQKLLDMHFTKRRIWATNKEIYKKIKQEVKQSNVFIEVIFTHEFFNT